MVEIMRRAFGVALVGVAMFVSGVARAQCSKDTDCKGDRICNDGRCTAPSESAGQSPATQQPQLLEQATEKPKVKKRIGNPGLMVGGIVLASAAPIVLAVGIVTTPCDASRCDFGSRFATFGLVSLAMIGAAIPMIIVGAKRVPVQSVAVGPLLAPKLAGLQLQLRL